MKDTFSFTRFALLLRKHLTEEYKQYLVLSAGIFSIMMVLNALTSIGNLHGQYDARMPEVTFIGGFIFGGCIFASLSYHFFQNTAKGIRFLQLPASQFEKTAVMFVLTQVVFTLVFLLLFYTTNWIMCTIYNNFKVLPANIPPERAKFFEATLYDINSVLARRAIVLFFVLSTIAHFGSLVFQKIAFLKTTLVTIIIGAIIFLINYHYMKSAIPEDNMPSGLFFNELVRLGGTYEHPDIKGFIVLPAIWHTSINYLLPGILYTSFWFAGYWKLKEKQI